MSISGWWPADSAAFAHVVDEVERCKKVLELKGAHQFTAFDLPPLERGEAIVDLLRIQCRHDGSPGWRLVAKSGASRTGA